MRPLPELTAENTAFWTGGADGKLLIAFCAACDHAIHPPQIICPKCWSETVENRPVPGTGTFYSYTVNHQPWPHGLAVPFALAAVDVRSEERRVGQECVIRVALGGRRIIKKTLETTHKRKQQHKQEKNIHDK